jgi:ribosomal protein L11 methyltransferase
VAKPAQVDWLALSFALAADQVDAVSDELLELGAFSVDVADADAETDSEHPIFAEPGEAHHSSWQRNVLTALFNPNHTPSLDPIVAHLLTEHAVPLDAIKTFTVAEQDWVRLTQSQFGVIEIDPRLAIVPSWEAAPGQHAICLRLDPGLAFGTGSHPTTSLCLRWLLSLQLANKTVIDYGCGSGILAIAAAKMGAASVSGLDIDLNAVRAAKDNAERNQAKGVFVDASHKGLGQFDVVVANILANPLCVLAPSLAQLMKPQAVIALSGILATQAEMVIAAYSPWVKLTVWGQTEDWVCLSNTIL